jgi:glutamyl-Q tRNA(Asp) synthetase
MRPMEKITYRGRFAPSPTGPLHFGSLAAALGSYLDARAHGGEWLVRIDDLDLPRVVAGAADDILRTLEALGLEWDGEIVYQSRRDDYYRAALAELEHLGAVYPCACTRKEIADSAVGPDGAAIYPGTCRAGLAPGRTARAVRLRVEDAPLEFADAVQGRVFQHLGQEVGDFVVRRADGLFAYQLATVVDDAAQGITHVVRGSDLLDSTPRQIYLQRLLGLPVPRYAHLPVAVNERGEKLSKQTLAPAVSATRAVLVLHQALQFLGQEIPGELLQAEPAEFLRWAAASWKRDGIPRKKTIPV